MHLLLFLNLSYYTISDDYESYPLIIPNQYMIPYHNDNTKIVIVSISKLNKIQNYIENQVEIENKRIIQVDITPFIYLIFINSNLWSLITVDRECINILILVFIVCVVIKWSSSTIWISYSWYPYYFFHLLLINMANINIIFWYHIDWGWINSNQMSSVEPVASVMTIV